MLLDEEETFILTDKRDILTAFYFGEYCPDDKVARGEKLHSGIYAYVFYKNLKLGSAFLEKWRKAHANLEAAKKETEFFESYTRSHEGSYPFMVVERMYEHLGNTHVPAPAAGAGAGAGAGGSDIHALLAKARDHHSRRQALELSHLVFRHKLEVAEIWRDLRGKVLHAMVEKDKETLEEERKMLANAIATGKSAHEVALMKEDLEDYEEEHAALVEILKPVLKDTSYRWKWEVPMGPH